MYKISFTNRDGEKCTVVVIANTEEEAVEVFHREITKAKPEFIYKVNGPVTVITRGRR